MMFGCVVTEYYYNSFYAPSVRSSIVYLSQAFDLSNSMSLYISSTCTLVMLKSLYFMTDVIMDKPINIFKNCTSKESLITGM